MVDTPLNRKVHIKRLFGKRAEGDSVVEDQDVYLDVARMDEIKVSLRAGAQIITAVLKWQDKPGETPNPTRITKTLKIYDPENPPADLENPDLYVPLDIVEECTVYHRGLPRGQQKIKLILKNDPEANTLREVTPTRITHRDTPKNDAKLNVGQIVQLDAYVRVEPFDATQYVDVEVVKEYKTSRRGGSNDPPQPVRGQRVRETFIQADYMFDQEVPGGAPNPPWRLDPFQNIVNAQWGSEQDTLVALGMNVGAEDNPINQMLLRRYNAKTGALKFEVSRNYYLAMDCAIGPNSRSAVSYLTGFVGAGASMATSYDENGAEEWTLSLAAAVRGLSFDGEGNLFICIHVSPGEARGLVKVSPSGAQIWESTVAPAPGQCSADPWGNCAVVGISSLNLFLVSHNGSLKWSVTDGVNRQCACDNQGNVWVVVVGDQVRKYDHFGTLKFTLSPPMPSEFYILYSIDTDTSGMCWALVSDLVTPIAYGINQDGIIERTVSFPPITDISQGFNKDGDVPGISAAGTGLAHVASYIVVTFEDVHPNHSAYITRLKRTDESVILSVIKTGEHGNTPHIRGIAKRMNTKKSLDSEPTS